MNKIRIFLTGGGGFIGKNFIEQRNKIYDIISPSHKELDLLNNDKVDKFFRKNNFDVVLHCANIGGLRSDKDNKDVLNTNLKIFSNLVKNKNHFKKMISLGSGAEYDKSRDITNVKESDFGRFIPKDNYGLCKYQCSKYIENSTNIFHIRLFGVFGKYEDYRVKFISNLICKYILRQPLTMIQNAHFNYLDIDDLIKILDFFIVNIPKYKFYNIGTRKRFSLLSIAKIINQQGDYKLPIKIQKNGFNNEYTCCCDRLKNELTGFKFTKMENSIRKLYGYYLKNIHNFDKTTILKDEYNKK